MVTPRSVLIPLVALAACTDDPLPVTEDRTVVFGEGGTPSASAAELFAKSDAMPTKDIVGVYEHTDSSSMLYNVPNMGSTVGIVKNNYARRVEVRGTQIVTGMKCDLVFTNPDRPAKTLMPFFTQPAEFANDVFAITMAGGRGETDPDSLTECTAMRAAETWALCVWVEGLPGGYEIPAGQKICAARDGSSLVLYRKVSNGPIMVDTVGVKVAN